MARARFELAAGQVAVLVGDLRLLPERAGDQLGQRHRLGVRAQLSMARSASSSASALISIAVAPKVTLPTANPPG